MLVLANSHMGGYGGPPLTILSFFKNNKRSEKSDLLLFLKKLRIVKGGTPYPPMCEFARTSKLENSFVKFSITFLNLLCALRLCGLFLFDHLMLAPHHYPIPLFQENPVRTIPHFSIHHHTQFYIPSHEGNSPPV